MGDTEALAYRSGLILPPVSGWVINGVRRPANPCSEYPLIAASENQKLSLMIELAAFGQPVLVLVTACHLRRQEMLQILENQALYPPM